jgi:hypothetical protein
MDAINIYNEVRLGPSTGTVPILVPSGLTSTLLVPELELWHLHWLVSLQSMGSLHPCVP